jgi:hypothetical protein
MEADDLHANGDPVAIIEYHNGDPFATIESNDCNTYYRITVYPTAWFDGSYNSDVGGSNTNCIYFVIINGDNQRANKKIFLNK